MKYKIEISGKEARSFAGGWMGDNMRNMYCHQKEELSEDKKFWVMPIFLTYSALDDQRVGEIKIPVEIEIDIDVTDKTLMEERAKVKIQELVAKSYDFGQIRK